MTCFRPLWTAVAALMIAALCYAPAAASQTAQYASIIHTYNPRLPKHQSRNLASAVIRDAQRAHIDARLLTALITVESHWRLHAVSRAGARGLGQLMPTTARRLGVDPLDPLANLFGTSTYLSHMLHKFGTSGNGIHLAVAAYNAGPLAVRRARGIPNNGETPRYVRKVISLWHALSGKVSDATRAPADTFVVATIPIQPYLEIVSVDPTDWLPTPTF